MEVLTAAGVNHLLHDLLICLMLECTSVPLLLLPLLVRCPVNGLIALEERADLLIHLLLFRFAPVGGLTVQFLMLGSVARWSCRITCCSSALTKRVALCTQLR